MPAEAKIIRKKTRVVLVYRIKGIVVDGSPCWSLKLRQTVLNAAVKKSLATRKLQID
jgi:hypothetical protein